MPDNEIPPAEQSITNIVNLQHQIAEEHTPHGTSVGKVIAPPPDIKIAWNNVTLNKERIYIDEYLLIGHKREAKGHLKSGTQEKSGGKEYAEFESHDHDIDNDYTDTIIYTDTLKVGDLVEVTPLKGDQLFIVKCKLIYLGKGDGYEVAKRVE